MLVHKDVSEKLVCFISDCVWCYLLFAVKYRFTVCLDVAAAAGTDRDHSFLNY